MEEVAIIADKIILESENLKQNNPNKYMEDLQAFFDENERIGDSY